MNNTFVALPASPFDDFPVVLLDTKRLWKMSRSEGYTVPKAVGGFCEVLRDQPLGRVTIIAACHRMVRGLRPRLIVISHDVAVHACPRIVGKVRSALCIKEGIAHYTARNTDRTSDDPCQCSIPPHTELLFSSSHHVRKPMPVTSTRTHSNSKIL